MMTKEQYIESLRKLNLNLYRFGKKVENVVDDPIVHPSLNSFAATYALAENPEYEDLMTATSNLTGKMVNRFTHLHQSTDDLIKKVKIQRLLGQKTAACFQRCVGMDAANAVYNNAFIAEAKAFTQAVLNDTETPVSCIDGIGPVKIAIAANKSLKEGRPVKLSEIC